MAIRSHPHALERMVLRGTTGREVEATVEEGEEFPARFGRTGFQRNFLFDSTWLGRYYRVKQVEAYAVREGDDRRLSRSLLATFEELERLAYHETDL